MSQQQEHREELVNVLFRATRAERREIHRRARSAGFENTATYLRSLALGERVEPWKIGNPGKGHAAASAQERLVS